MGPARARRARDERRGQTLAGARGAQRWHTQAPDRMARAAGGRGALARCAPVHRSARARARHDRQRLAEERRHSKHFHFFVVLAVAVIVRPGATAQPGGAA
eukprot:11089688-Lingulodinium_polyedra.AAC.1